MDNYIAFKYLIFFVTVSFCSAAIIRSLDRPCQAEVSRIKKEREGNSLSANFFVLLPQCDKDGYYKTLQRTSEGYYCSTSLGSPVDLTDYSAPGPCKRLKRCVKVHQAPGAKDHKLIRCDKFGYFKPVQRTDAGKICVRLFDGKALKTTNVSRKRDCYDVIGAAAL